jgi:hypothetical protein
MVDCRLGLVVVRFVFKVTLPLKTHSHTNFLIVQASSFFYLPSGIYNLSAFIYTVNSLSLISYYKIILFISSNCL